MAAAPLEGLDLDAPLRSEAPAAEGPATRAPDAHEQSIDEPETEAPAHETTTAARPDETEAEAAADELSDPHDAPRHDASG